jgi:hypothetical protein
MPDAPTRGKAGVAPFRAHAPSVLGRRKRPADACSDLTVPAGMPPCQGKSGSPNLRLSRGQPGNLAPHPDQ